jgi:hypothetical protein
MRRDKAPWGEPCRAAPKNSPPQNTKKHAFLDRDRLGRELLMDIEDEIATMALDGIRRLHVVLIDPESFELVKYHLDSYNMAMASPTPYVFTDENGNLPDPNTLSYVVVEKFAIHSSIGLVDVKKEVKLPPGTFIVVE